MSDGPGQPTKAVVKALFGLSGNRCAFPGCTEEMVDINGVVKGKVCHIKGNKPTSARYDPEQTNRERHGFHNLIVMCGTHSTEIDAQGWEDRYPVETLQEMKRKNEVEMGGQEIDPSTIKIEGSEAVTFSQGQSGGVTAHNLNLIQATPASPALEQDRILLQEVIALAQPDVFMPFMKEHDFGGSFLLASIEPAHELRALSTRVDKEFLDSEIQGFFMKLITAIEAFLIHVARHTFPVTQTGGPHMNSVPKEWRYEQRDRYEKATEALNDAADVETFKTFVRMSRGKLAR